MHSKHAADISKQKLKLSVVVPTINSEKFIYGNVVKLNNFIKSLPYIKDYEILIAAQTSEDKTFQVIRKFKDEKIRPLLIKKKGKGIGLSTGFKKAKYDWVLMIDDDLPYPFESIRQLFSKRDGYDLIIASRYVERTKHKIPLIRRIASLVYITLVKFLLGIPQNDIQAGMKLIKKKLFHITTFPKENGYVWDTEMLFLANKAKFKILEVPVECIHKPNKLVVYKVALPMFLGVLRVRLRYLLKKINKK